MQGDDGIDIDILQRVIKEKKTEAYRIDNHIIASCIFGFDITEVYSQRE